MSDFNWDDFDSDDDLFGTNRDDDKESERIASLKRVHRMMFINDIEKYRTQPVPLDPIEFIDLFGKPTNEDMRILTQAFLADYHVYDNIHSTNIYDRWGLAWIYEIMEFNARIEEYEISALLRDIIQDRPLNIEKLIKEK